MHGLEVILALARCAGRLALDLSVARQLSWPVDLSVLFELVAHRYEQHSMVITSNQSFEYWDKLFADAMMTVAALDRLVHHATILQCEGESYRRKVALEKQGT